MSFNTIVIKGNGIRKEAEANAAITPGHLIERMSTGKVRVHSSAGGVAQRSFALENEVFGKDLTDAYAASDRVLYEVLPAGAEVYALVAAAAAAIAVGDFLESDGAGGLRKATSQASYFLDGAAADGGLTFTAKETGPGGEDIEVIVADAGSASVVVDGNKITITPGSGANTANAVKTQVEANAAANALISVTVEGAGTGEPGVTTGVFLSGAVGNPIAQALEAVDNSGGGTPARILVELLP